MRQCAGKLTANGGFYLRMLEQNGDTASAGHFSEWICERVMHR